MLQSSNVTDSGAAQLPSDLPRPVSLLGWASKHASKLAAPCGLIALAVALPFMNGAYPIRDWLFWRIAWLWLWSALYSAACVSAGYVLLTRALKRTALPTLETTVTSFALGVTAFTLVMYVAGAFALYKTWFAVLLPFAMIAAGAKPFAAFVRERRAAAAAEPYAPAGFWVKLAWVAGVVCLFFVYVEALTPDAISFDANWYHLPPAQDYARAGKIVPFFSQYNRALPQLATFLFTWGWLIPWLNPSLRWMMALHLEFTCFIWTLAGIAALARWMLGDSRHRGTWAAFFFFPIIFVYDSNLGGCADHILAMFAPPALLAAARALPRFEWRSSALAGALFGASLLTKYQAVYLLGALGVVLTVVYVRAFVHIARRKEAESRGRAAKRLLAGAAALIGTFAVVVSPHFVKNFIFYRNPFYPFLQRVIRSYPTTPKSALFMTYLFADGGGFEHKEPLAERVRQALRFALTAPFEPHYSFTHDVPALGALFVLLLPFALFIKDRKRVWLTIAIAYMAAVVWAWTYMADRYLQAIVPLFAAVVAAVLVRAWELSSISRVALVPLVALQIIWGGDTLFYSGDPGAASHLSSAMTMMRSGLDGRIRGRFEYRINFVRLGRSLPNNALALLHAERINLGIDRDLIFDSPRTQAYVYYNKIKGPRALYDYYKHLGITHLIWSSSTWDDHSKQAEALFNDFIFNYAEGRKKFGGLNVAAMPKTRPPPDSEFLVLIVSTSYENGLYPLQRLTKQELLPKERQGKYPTPIEQLRDVKQAQPLIDRARVVILASADKTAKSIAAKLKNRFVKGIHYSGHDVYVRRQGQEPSPSDAEAQELPPSDVEGSEPPHTGAH